MAKEIMATDGRSRWERGRDSDGEKQAGSGVGVSKKV